MVIFERYPKKNVRSILVREVLSHTCEWLNSSTENGGVPHAVALITCACGRGCHSKKKPITVMRSRIKGGMCSTSAKVMVKT